VFNLTAKTESSFQNVVLEIKERMIYNVKNYDNYINLNIYLCVINGSMFR
jgi:hypothetical protein